MDNVVKFLKTKLMLFLTQFEPKVNSFTSALRMPLTLGSNFCTLTQ